MRRQLLLTAVALIVGALGWRGYFEVSAKTRAWRHYFAGKELSHCGEYNLEAINHFKQALNLNPNLFEAREALADIYESSGMREEAVSLYLRAKAENPSEPRVYHALAQFALEEKDYTQAIKHLKSALALDSKDLYAMRLLAYCYRKQRVMSDRH